MRFQLWLPSTPRFGGDCSAGCGVGSGPGLAEVPGPGDVASTAGSGGPAKAIRPSVGGGAAGAGAMTAVGCAGVPAAGAPTAGAKSEEHTSELQSLRHLVCRL